MAPDWKYKNHPADRSLKEDLLIDTTFDPSCISWDTPFKPKYGAYIFKWDAHREEMIVASQWADSSKWLAAILLIAEIIFPLQFEQISSDMPISAISQ